MNRTISIDKKTIGDGSPCFIVAEISANHHQNYEEAESLVRAAKYAGADAVKLQTYTADTMTLNSEKEYFRISGRDQPETWKGEILYHLYKKASTPWKWHPNLKKLADEIGILLFSSPFDETAVDFLEEKVDVKLYKIASYEVVHIPLLQKVASMHKPVILSIGFANVEEIKLALQSLKSHGASDIIVLHCVTAYSDCAKLSELNLLTINDIRKRFQVIAGFSDNNGGMIAPIIAAIENKAAVIEKHLTLSRNLGGPDARFSLEPQELKEMIVRIRRGEKEGIESALKGIGNLLEVKTAQGNVSYGPSSPQEIENVVFRPSIWIKKSIKKGEKLTLQNSCIARPGFGLPPKLFGEVIGRVAKQDIEAATPLTYDLIESVIAS